MTLPSSGTLTTAQVALEIYGDSNATVVIPSTDVRTLVGKPTGDIIFPDDFYGKTWDPVVSSFHTITIGQSGSLNFGYRDSDASVFGECSPRALTNPADAEITGLYVTNNVAPSTTGTLRLEIQTTGTAAETDITDNIESVVIDGLTYLIADASISVATIANYTAAAWTGVDQIFGSTPGGTKEIEIRYV